MCKPLTEPLLFGDRLKALRLHHEYSPDELAERIGVAKSLIWSFEIGKKQPTYPQLILLADTFGVSTDFLLDRDNAPIDFRDSADSLMSRYDFSLDGVPLSKDELLEVRTWIREKRVKETPEAGVT